MLVDRSLERRLDARPSEECLQLLRLVDAARDRDLDELGHAPDPTSCVPWPPTAALDELGLPALGQRDVDEVEVTRDDGRREHAVASSATSDPAYRAERCVSASRRTPASRATPAASSAVEWSVSRARSRSSARNVASWTSTSAPAAAATTDASARCRR